MRIHKNALQSAKACMQLKAVECELLWGSVGKVKIFSYLFYLYFFMLFFCYIRRKSWWFTESPLDFLRKTEYLSFKNHSIWLRYKLTIKIIYTYIYICIWTNTCSTCDGKNYFKIGIEPNLLCHQKLIAAVAVLLEQKPKRKNK